MTLSIATLISAFTIALITSKLIIYFFGKRLLDIPNDRSSHTTPTPRGGGIAIVLGTIGASLFAYFSGGISKELLIPLLPGVIMAAVGIIDDIKNLNILIRLGLQIVTAILISSTLLNDINEPPFLELLLFLTSAIGIVWLTNLYNFMDGINGLAALQTIFVCISMSLLFYLQATHVDVAIILILLALASLGFLYWNFPTAQIFMGDVGSLFIGITLATLMVWTSRDSFITSCSWLILMAAFITDATYTLLMRIKSGQKFYLPHRSHLYQKLALKRKSHTQATLLIMAFNIFWLLPIALMIQIGWLNEFIGLCLAYTPAIYCAYKMKAGKTTL